MGNDHVSAIVVQRVDPDSTSDTAEIVDLTKSAGFSVEGILTQSHEEDSEYHIGSGKVPEINHMLRESNASVVIFDNELDPYQKYNLGIYFPDDITVLDKYSLILEIFERNSSTRHGQLQVELARLRYELPRVETKVRLSKKEEKPGFMGLGEYDESEEEDIKRRIRRIQEELESMEEDKEKRRENRRDNGFDIVAIAGYTNVGKSTLLRRLAEDHSVDENENLHQDLDPTAESKNRLFTTLDTTTRRMEYDKRDVLLTDTVGFISDLPHWLIDSFNSTFDSVYGADLVLLVADITEPVEKIREKLVSCHDLLENKTDSRIVTVYNKIDLIDPDDLDRKLDALERLSPNSVEVSAKSGINCSKLKDKIHRSLPPLEQDRVYIPMTDETMSLVSWIHNNTYVQEQEFDEEGVTIKFEARPETSDKIKGKLSGIQSHAAR